MNSEFNFDEIMERIKIACNTRTYNALAELLGLSSSGFANLKKRNSVPFDKIIALANSLNVSIDWVLTGKGEMLKGEHLPTNAEISPRIARMAELLDGLNDDQQREVFAAVAEKKRLNTLEATIAELLKRTA